jgi:hypothetical protein
MIQDPGSATLLGEYSIFDNKIHHYKKKKERIKVFCIENYPCKQNSTGMQSISKPPKKNDRRQGKVWHLSAQQHKATAVNIARTAVKESSSN